MRKLSIIGIILISLIFPNFVKADTSIIEVNNGFWTSDQWCSIHENNYGCGYTYQEAYNDIMTEYNNNYRNDYPYYILYNQRNASDGQNILRVRMNKNGSNTFSAELENFGISLNGDVAGIMANSYLNDWYYDENDGTTNYAIQGSTYVYYESNIDIKVSGNNYTLEGFYNTDDIVLEIGDSLPMYNELIQYNSWSEYLSNNNQNLREVNLQNYNYVILALKNYNRKEAFKTNLQIKGQIGITPVYNYGQTSKDAITGVKVQDRCNTSYENYTTYPLYILEEDIRNNAIFIVKQCEENSKIKYDDRIFTITYVTEENESDPTVTINGQTYHTIPFSDLPSTANKNEEENYIPGESGSANSEGGLSGALKNIQQKMSEIWDVITFFSGFVNQMFSILPDPIQIILMSAFAIAITLGLIKIFIN